MTELVDKVNMVVRMCCDPRVTDADLRIVVSMVFAFHNTSTGQCNPSQPKIAAASTKHKATVIRTIAKMESLGYVMTDRSDGGRNKRNEYSFDWEGKTVAPCDRFSEGSVKDASSPLASSVDAADNPLNFQEPDLVALQDDETVAATDETVAARAATVAASDETVAPDEETVASSEGNGRTVRRAYNTGKNSGRNSGRNTGTNTGKNSGRAADAASANEILVGKNAKVPIRHATIEAHAWQQHYASHGHAREHHYRKLASGQCLYEASKWPPPPTMSRRKADAGHA